MRKRTSFWLLALAAAVVWLAPSAAVADEAADGHHAAAGGHESAGYSSQQWRDFGWRVANFAVFAALLVFLVRKPLTGHFRGRRENIARTKEYLETQARNLEEQTKVMTRKLAELDQEREAVLAQCARDGAKERDRILAEAAKTAELIIARAEAAMEQEIRTARRTLTVEAGRLAASLAEELLIKNVTEDDRIRLTHEFIEQVVKLPARN
jgi:F-type H+-transporting ATPase subunit b